MKSLKETMQARSTALGHKLQAEAAVKAVRARLAQLRSSGKPEAVLQVRLWGACAEQSFSKLARCRLASRCSVDACPYPAAACVEAGHELQSAAAARGGLKAF